MTCVEHLVLNCKMFSFCSPNCEMVAACGCGGLVRRFPSVLTLFCVTHFHRGVRLCQRCFVLFSVSVCVSLNQRAEAFRILGFQESFWSKEKTILLLSYAFIITPYFGLGMVLSIRFLGGRGGGIKKKQKCQHRFPIRYFSSTFKKMNKNKNIQVFLFFYFIDLHLSFNRTLLWSSFNNQVKQLSTRKNA